VPLGGPPEGERAGEARGAGGAGRPGAVGGAPAEARAVQHRRAVAHEAFLAEGGRVNEAEMAHRRPRAHVGAARRRHVNDRAVLHVGAAADDDGREVGPHYRVVPDGGVLLHGDVADEFGGGRDERGGMHARRFAFEREERHGRLLSVTIAPLIAPARWTWQEAGCSLRHMGAPRIVAVATSTPSHRFDQATLLRLAGYDDTLRSGFFRHSEIDGRHLFLDPASFTPTESVDELSARFRRGAIELGAQAVRRAVAGAGWALDDVDFLANSTCVGRLWLSLDAHIISAHGLKPTIQRVHVGDTGCASAMVALQQAANHVQAFPDHRAVVVAVEICSAAYFLDDRLESAVAHAIFADGAGAL